MTRVGDVFVSVVVRSCNAERFLEPALARLSGVMEASFAHYEIVIVDDASTDGTPGVISKMQQKARNIQSYRFARAKGDNVALTAGLDHAIGDMVVILDLRLDPPELIPQMVALASGGVGPGADIVYALPRERLEAASAHDRLATWFLRRLARLHDVDVPAAMSSYRLFSRAVLSFILKAGGRHRMLPILPAMSGYPFLTVEYDRLPFDHGATRPSRIDRVWKAVDLVFSSSTRPLRIITLVSLGISLLTVFYSIYVVLVVAFLPGVASGWASLSLEVSGLFFLVCIVLAVMSEYLLQVLETSDRLPRYHIADQTHSSTMTYARNLNVIDTKAADRSNAA